ncbi:hypothetical protein GCM10009696_35400 [Kocuria himachalensis]
MLAADQRVTRFVGDGQLWAPLVIQDRVRAALRQEPVEQVGAARWYVAEEGGWAIGLVASTRRRTGVEVGYWGVPEHWGCECPGPWSAWLWSWPRVSTEGSG